MPKLDISYHKQSNMTERAMQYMNIAAYLYSVDVLEKREWGL